MEVLAVLLTLLSGFSILLTSIILGLNFTKKLEPKSKRVEKKNLNGDIPVKPTEKSKSKDEISKLWIIPFIVFIVVLVALIFAVFMMETDMEEEKMHNIMSDTNIILESARERVDTVPLSRLADSKNDINGGIIVRYEFMENTGFWELKLNNYRTLVSGTIGKMMEFQIWINGVILKFPSTCLTKTDVDEDKVKYQISKANKIRSNLETAIRNVSSIFDEIEDNLAITDKSQQNLDIGESKIENHINTMKAMLDHFGTDINNTEITRQKWSKEMSSSLPTFSTHFIITILVPFSCGAMILICIVFIIIIIRPNLCIGPKLSSIGTSSPVFITGLVIIITSVIVSVACLGFVGTWSCSLKDGYFGLSNFTSPYTKNITVSICETVGSNFFAGLGNDKLITSESVVQNLKVDEYKRKMLEIFTSSKLSIDIPAEFSQKLNAIEKSLKKLDDLFEQNCLEVDDQQKLAEYQQILKIFLNESVNYIGLIETFNGNVARTESIVTPLIDDSYTEIVNSFHDDVNKIKQQITASDFSCNPIIENYSKTADSICKKFEVPLEPYWIILMLTILVFVIILIFLVMLIDF